MKKIGLISTAAVAVALLAPSAAQSAVTQRLDVKIDGKTSVTAGSKKKPKIVKMSVSTGTLGTSDSGQYDPITYAKISLPKGIALNYKRFPACKGTDAIKCSSKTRVGKGSAKANVAGVDYAPDGDLEQYIGSGANLLIRVMFEKPALIDETLIGKVTTKGGAYAFDFNVPEILQVPVPPDGIEQLIDFTTNFDKKKVKKGKKTYGLIELQSCPKEGYVFKGEFKYRSGTSATAETTVKCKSPKKGKKSKR